MNYKKRILVVSAVFPPEPVTSATLNYDLAAELAKEYDVTVLRPYPTRPFGMQFDNADVSDYTFRTILIHSYTHPKSSLFGRFRESIDFGKKTAEYINKHCGEIDFVYNDGWQLFGLNIVAKACVKHKIPYIVPIQDIYPECLLTKANFPAIIKKLIISILLPIDIYYQKHAAKVRTISDEMAVFLSKTRGIPISNYLVVNNWQNDEDFVDVSVKNADEKLVFGYVGSINVHANVDMMIRAFKKANIPKSEFRIYGGGNQKEACQKLVAELGLKNVTFGFVSRNEIPAVQASVDALLLALPAGNGNLCLPSKLTSYMLSGKPVIASVDADSATNRIINGENCGLVIEPDNLEAMTEALEHFASLSLEERTKMSDNSRNYAMKHLTREVNLSLVVNEIKKILD